MDVDLQRGHDQRHGDEYGTKADRRPSSVALKARMAYRILDQIEGDDGRDESDNQPNDVPMEGKAGRAGGVGGNDQDGPVP